MTPRFWRADHVTVRRSDRWQMVLAWALFAQLGVGTMYVSLHAQRPTVAQTVREQEQRDRTQEIEKRLDAVDALRLDARLAVLEDLAARMGKIELVGYGLVLTMMGNLLLSVLQIKNQKERRA